MNARALFSLDWARKLANHRLAHVTVFCLRSNAWSRGQKAPPCVYLCTPQTDGGWDWGTKCPSLCSYQSSLHWGEQFLTHIHASKKVRHMTENPGQLWDWRMPLPSESCPTCASGFQLCTASQWVQVTAYWRHRPRQRRSGLQTAGKCHSVPWKHNRSSFSRTSSLPSSRSLPGSLFNTFPLPSPLTSHYITTWRIDFFQKKPLELQQSSGLDIILHISGRHDTFQALTARQPFCQGC